MEFSQFPITRIDLYTNVQQTLMPRLYLIQIFYQSLVRTILYAYTKLSKDIAVYIVEYLFFDNYLCAINYL